MRMNELKMSYGSVVECYKNITLRNKNIIDETNYWFKLTDNGKEDFSSNIYMKG